MPGTKQGDNVMPPPRHPLDKGYRAHNCNVYPQRPDRCYLAYIDGGMLVLDISDKANPKRISSWTNSPPYTGFMHTVVPLFDRGLMLVTDESTENNAKDWPKLDLGARRARRDQPGADLDLPAARPPGLRRARAGSAPTTSTRTCRCRPAGSPTRSCSAPSSTAGLRAYDISNPYQPQQIGVFVPPAPPMAPTGTIQINDVFVDEREIVYCVDRHIGGLYILEMDF